MLHSIYPRKAKISSSHYDRLLNILIQTPPEVGCVHIPNCAKKWRRDKFDN